MSVSSADESSIPDAKTCEDRCQLFVQLTSTDVILAQFYLQDRNWNLERAVNAYFEENQSESPQDSTDAHPESNAKNTSVKDKKLSKESIEPSLSSASNLRKENMKRIRILSWNIDGLDTNNIRNRTVAVCQTILEEDPDVVYLQEVVPQSLDILEEKCAMYQIIPAGHTGYFTVMLLKVDAVSYEEHIIQPFHSSIMSRNLLKVKGKVKGINCLLMTSHLESTRPHAKERESQLKIIFKEMISASQNCTVIIGGDFNLRDAELQEVGGLPESVLDIWEVTGKRSEARYTWDLMRNDNLEWVQKFRPRCRFDRFFLRHDEIKKLKPVYFELVGIQRLKSCQRFASDHWGILSHYDII